MSKLYLRALFYLACLAFVVIIMLHVMFFRAAYSSSVEKQDMVMKANFYRGPWAYEGDEEDPWKLYSDDITIVTAYFNIGSFLKKGRRKPKIYSASVYSKRLEQYGRMLNPVVAYFDDKNILELFKNIRSKLPAERTRTFLMKRIDLLSFQKLPTTKDVLSRKGYPKFHPDTVVPEYGCSMNAKYELTNDAARNNYFNTTYFAWLDAGFFHDPSDDNQPFMLATPPGYDPRKVAYGQMLPRDPNLSTKQIFLTNQLWVCGCVFLARRDVMLEWTKSYLRFAELFLMDGLASTDEQVVYAMINRGDGPNLQIQAYWERPAKNDWSVLGYVMKNSWRNHEFNNKFGNKL